MTENNMPEREVGGSLIGGRPSSVIPSSVSRFAVVNRELKPEQEEAAHTLDRHVSVTAGPGAGKTTVLVERYLHILRTRDVSVDQIVAITFTNRAANEMRERLRAELDNLVLQASHKDRPRWMRHKRTLDGAVITTIHGFCSRLLREFPVEADIDPQFILLEAHQSAILEEATAEGSLTELINIGDQAITELAAGIGRPNLVRGLINIYRSIRNQGLNIQTIQTDISRNHRPIDEYQRLVEELSLKMREFLSARRVPPTAEKKRLEAYRRWPKFHEFLLAVTDATQPAAFCEGVQSFRNATRPNASGSIRELVKQLDQLIWQDKLGGSVARAFFDLRAKRYALEVAKVVSLLERKLDAEKRRKSALDFDDLQLRALKLLEQHPETLRRATRRYRFFLIDEFQDTNALQRDLMARLALAGDAPTGANLFIVGDRKQSIYGFRGADVDVFRELTERIEARNGLPVSLNRNFRSQSALIRFFNFLFDRMFECSPTLDEQQRNQLGYVAHEASIAAREEADPQPVVELLIDSKPSEKTARMSRTPKPRERDAEQLAARITSMVGSETITGAGGFDGQSSALRKIEFRDIALLFRAMTEVHIYESSFRRAGIPYVTVDGKGFYSRQEVTDLMQLLRFLDNKTDEVALAAVLRSPLCGLSDDALFALRCAPLKTATQNPELISQSRIRPLFESLSQYESIDFIDQDDGFAIQRAREFLETLIWRSKRSGLSELLRFAVDESQYRTVAAANFDGAQRLSNVEKLFSLALRFERSGAYLIRDFVRFVHDFEEAGARESEGQIDDTANAVRLMSIHQSKGLEFPVVIIPDLHRLPDNRTDWWALDRHRGLTLKVPDGRGGRVQGLTFADFLDRAKRRDEFESMRLLYVAATRAQDRLILSGAIKDSVAARSWLGWISSTLGIEDEPKTATLRPEESLEVMLTVNLADAWSQDSVLRNDSSGSLDSMDLTPPDTDSLPLLQPIEAERGSGLHRFNVTQLLNYQRCPRQYYFDRVLSTPGEEELGIWNNADAPEPPANLTATLRGAVIHRFCERYREGDDLLDSLKRSFDDVLRLRAAELGDRILEIDADNAIRDISRLAQNYASSNVRKRIEAAHALANGYQSNAKHLIGALSEQRFRLRRPLGILTGSIDKLLIVPSETGGLVVEIIDFKTNRFRGKSNQKPDSNEGTAQDGRVVTRKGRGAIKRDQLSFDFIDIAAVERDLLMQAEIEAAAIEYRVQMQAYALAALDLLPGVERVQVTLHFLDPNVEVCLADELLDRETCSAAIDEVMAALVGKPSPERFPATPAEHCRVCNFVELCAAGRNWLNG